MERRPGVGYTEQRNTEKKKGTTPHPLLSKQETTLFFEHIHAGNTITDLYKDTRLTETLHGENASKWLHTFSKYGPQTITDMLAECHRTFIIGQARKMNRQYLAQRTEIPFDTLMNAGMMGMHTAIERFKPTHESKNSLLGYAKPWVTFRMQEAIAQEAGVKRYLMSAINMATYRIEGYRQTQRGEVPTKEQLQKILIFTTDLSVKRINRIVDFLFIEEQLILNKPIGDSNTEFLDSIEKSKSVRDPEPDVEKDLILDALARLPSTQQAIIKSYVGMTTDKPQTPHQIAKQQNMTLAEVIAELTKGLSTLKTRPDLEGIKKERKGDVDTTIVFDASELPSKENDNSKLRSSKMNQIIHLYKQGLTRSQIKNEVNTSLPYISNILSPLIKTGELIDWEKQKKEEQKKRIIELHNEGMTSKDISKTLEIPINTLRAQIVTLIKEERLTSKFKMSEKTRMETPPEYVCSVIQWLQDNPPNRVI